jgi:hypothetical protein
MPLTIKRTNSTSIAANSVQFNGTSQYLTLPASSNWAMTGDFTVECWVNTNLPSNYSGTILGLGSNSSAYAGLRFQITRASSGATPVSIEVLISISGGSWGLTGATSGLMVNGEWNHVAVVRSGGIVTAYINGIGYNIGTINGTLYAGPYNSIGKLDGYSPNGFYYNGYISNLRILNGTALYTASFTVPTSPLTAVANTSLLTCNAATIVDNSSNNLAITNNNAATVSSINPFRAPINNFQFARRASTAVGRSVLFNGTSRYLRVANNAVLIPGLLDFTIEGWVNLTSYSDLNFLYSKGVDGSDAASIGFGVYITTGKLWATFNADNIIITGATTLSLNTWYHIAITRQSNIVRMWLDGVQDSTDTTVSNNVSTTAEVRIGRGRGTSTNYFNGYISNFRFIRGTALYTSTFDPSTVPLTAIANTQLLTCNAATIVDSSTNNFAITNNNGATVSSISPFVASGGGMSLKKVFADPIFGTQKAIFGYGYSGGNVSMTNLVSNTGVVATDTTGVGTARYDPAAAGYGTDKAIFGYGYTTTYVSMTNLVSNTGVVSTDTTGVGTARAYLAAAGYGSDKAIFGYGGTITATAITNLVSNTGVVATDTTGIGTARYDLAAAGYGSDKAIFGYGSTGTNTAITNLVSNTGVVVTDTAGVGAARMQLAAAGYGTDKTIFGYGYTTGVVSMTNLVSNTGVVSTDTTGVGTARRWVEAASYGGDRAIFGYGSTGTITAITNLVSNTGVVATDTTGVGTARQSLAAAGYSLT